MLMQCRLSVALRNKKKTITSLLGFSLFFFIPFLCPDRSLRPKPIANRRIFEERKIARSLSAQSSNATKCPFCRGKCGRLPLFFPLLSSFTSLIFPFSFSRNSTIAKNLYFALQNAVEALSSKRGRSCSLSLSLSTTRDTRRDVDTLSARVTKKAERDTRAYIKTRRKTRYDIKLRILA